MDTDMVKIVADRLRSQSLDEIRLVDNDKVEERDSGTESDEELSSITQGMLSTGTTTAAVRRPVLSTGTATASSSSVRRPVPSTSSPVLRDSLLAKHQLPSSSTSSTSSPPPPPPQVAPSSSSPTTHHDCSDFERCSFDFEPGVDSTDCSVDYDDSRYDVQVLLTDKITKAAAAVAAECDSELADLFTDTRSPASGGGLGGVGGGVLRCGSCGSLPTDDDEEDEDDSEEERRQQLGPVVRTSPGPLRFRSSPPRGLHKLNKRTISPKVFLASVYPRSRPANTIPRPYLDFEKMQVTRTRILYSVV